MSKWLPNEENDIRLKEHIGSFNLQSSSQLSTIAEVFAEAKCFFLYLPWQHFCRGNHFQAKCVYLCKIVLVLLT